MEFWIKFQIYRKSKYPRKRGGENMQILIAGKSGKLPWATFIFPMILKFPKYAILSIGHYLLYPQALMSLSPFIVQGHKISPLPVIRKLGGCFLSAEWLSRSCFGLESCTIQTCLDNVNVQALNMWRPKHSLCFNSKWLFQFYYLLCYQGSYEDRISRNLLACIVFPLHPPPFFSIQ